RGDGQRRDKGGAPTAKESKKNHDAEQAADDDGVAHIFDGGVDELSLVVNHPGLDVGRQPVFSQQILNVAGYIDRVAAQPTEDSNNHGVAPSEANRLHAVLMKNFDVGHVADE